MNLRCIDCRSTYPIIPARHRCDCGGLLDVVHDLSSLKDRPLKQLFETRQGCQEPPYSSGVWRYAELIFPIDQGQLVSCGEGHTGLYQSERLSKWVGLESLRLKHEGQNPTGSFKDRGMAVGTTHAKIVGASSVACASTGNTAASMAAYAASAGLTAFVFIPQGEIAYGKLSQAIAYQARTIQVKGDFDAVLSLVWEAAKSLGIYLLNSINPFRLEGQKSIILETLQQLRWSAPDWIVVPGGNLGNASAFGKALHELKELGLINRIPRLAVIQATGANPFYAAYKNGFRSFNPVKADTVASAIRIGRPVNYPRARRAIEWTNGVVEEVDDAEILDAKAQVDGAGIGCEPASAAAVAGAKKLLSKGIIKRGEAVVAILTGHLLKDPDTTVNYHLSKIQGTTSTYANRPIVIEPKLAEVIALLQRSDL
ncbi:MAG: threonine synthase [Chloroflexi bacterium]|nr:threonine synthase [Chloroflexota bacterium]MCL5076491.1 threonine synthase [Chloroflexota bacterium]